MSDLAQHLISRMGEADRMAHRAKQTAKKLHEAAGKHHDATNAEISALGRQIETEGIGTNEEAEKAYCHALVTRSHMAQAHTLAHQDAARMPELDADVQKAARSAPFEEAKHPRRKDGEFTKKGGEMRAWFGDSKVVDEDGNPKVVYHGSTAKFEEFDPDRRMATTNQADYGLGFYFSPSREMAEEFAASQDPKTGEITNTGHTYPVYLSIKQPWEAEEPLTTDDWEQVFNALPKGGVLRTNKGGTLNRMHALLKDGVAAVAKKRQVFSYFTGDLTQGDRQKAWHEVYLALQSLGYDGVKGDNEWVAWQPQQIKHVSSKEFDPDNPNMHKATRSGRFVPPDVPRWRAGNGKHGDRYLPLNGVEDVTKFREMAQEMAGGGWRWNVPLVKCGDQLLTGSHRYAAARTACVPLETVHIDDLFKEAGLDFKEAWEQHAQPFVSWLSNMDYAIQCLPQELRDRYGIDLG